MANVLVALTGGIGAGKTTVARMLARHGALVVDADRIARDVVDPATAEGRRMLARIAERFGPEFLAPDGSLDRRRIADRVFADAALRTDYNAIIHPAMMTATATALEQAEGIVVHEIPLLSSSTPPLPWRYDLVVTVEATPAVRRDRLVAQRGYAPEHAEARIAAQGEQRGRTEIADLVLRSDADLDELARRTAELWTRLRAMAEPPENV